MTGAVARFSPALLVLFFACGGGTAAPPSGSGDGGDEGVDAAAAAQANTTPMVVDLGPLGTMDDDVPFVTLTLCVPGTTNCQTIDHISVDTGSSGLRVIASELSSGLTLPQKTAQTGGSLAECFDFDDGFVWGSVRMADVKIAGEVAANIPIQIIGDPAFPSIPSDCSGFGPSQDSLAVFGAKGLIGISQLVADCGSLCANRQTNDPPTYYDCSGGGCTGVTLDVADQVSNPIASFPQDNNGAVVELASVSPSGAPTASGTLIFGIGTSANNGLGNATVLTLDEYANFSTVYKGQDFPASFIDSGTSFLGFNDSSIVQCASPFTGYYCPASALTLTAQNIGSNSATSTVSFTVENAETLLGNPTYAAYDDIAGPMMNPCGQNDTFDWGLPFFFGRKVFVALQGAQTPGGAGPYVAY
jgi:hypothetical protein